MDFVDILESIIRFVMVVLSLVAMWSLWVARRDRRATWADKMYDIWNAHFLFCLGIMMGNFQMWLSHGTPTFALIPFGLALIITVKGTFNGTFYTKPNDLRL